MHTRPTLTVIALVAALAAPTALFAPDAQATHAAPFDAFVPTRADDGHFTPVTAYVASTTPAPTLLWGHGWSGNRGGAAGDAEFFRHHGFNVVAMDFRGHGAARSSSEARVHDPAREIQDVRGVIDWIAGQPWAALDAPGDPVLGALGGSYGGGYQLLTAAFDDRLDAIAPDITWHDLPQALGPNGNAAFGAAFPSDGAVKSGWVDVLYGSGNALARVDPIIHQGYAWAMATNSFPDGASPGEPDILTMFKASSPKSYPAAIDIPTFLTQGMPDTLFNFNQAYANLQQVSATGADVRLVTHLGGHILNGRNLDSRLPPVGLQPTTSGSPCGDLREMRLTWYNQTLKGLAPTTPVPGLCIALDDGGSWTGATLPAATPSSVPGGPITLVQGLPSETERRTVVSIAADTTLAGIPTLSGTATLSGDDATLFFSLEVFSAGTSRLVGAQVTPVRLSGPGAVAFEIDLGGIGTRLGPGQEVVLVASSWNEQFGSNAGRSPGVVTLDGLTLGLPVA